MPSRRAWVAGGIAMAAGVGLVYALAPGKPEKGTRILLLGDSLAVGMALHFQGFAREERRAFDALAVRGTTVADWLASSRLPQVLTDFAPDMVLVSLGTNDAFSGKDPDVVGAEGARLVELLRAAGADVVWIGAPAMPESYGGREPSLDTLDVLEDSVTDAGAFYYDSTGIDIPRAADGLHSSPAGYAGWAGAVWQWLS